VSKKHSKNILFTTRSIEPSSALKSSWWVMKLFVDLSKTLGVNNLSRN
jgi:hypothetical protein